VQCYAFARDFYTSKWLKGCFRLMKKHNAKISENEPGRMWGAIASAYQHHILWLLWKREG